MKMATTVYGKQIQVTQEVYIETHVNNFTIRYDVDNYKIAVSCHKKFLTW
jgi:hypothetical protein